MKILKSHTGGSIFEFLKTIPRALYPHSYLELRHRTLKDSLKYFFSIIFVAYFIMFVIAVPKLIHLSNYIDTQFGKFKKLNLQLDIELSEPVAFTDKDPQVVITTQENSTNITYNKFLITANTIYFKESFGKTREINYRDYLNILAKKDSIRKIMVTLFYVMIPTTIFLMYFLSLVKYIIILSIATIFSYLMTRMIKYEVSIRQAFTSA
ncbi:MAG: DUF1189 family protein, partial [Nanoarchaeota archaeon]